MNCYYARSLYAHTGMVEHAWKPELSKSRETQRVEVSPTQFFSYLLIKNLLVPSQRFYNALGSRSYLQ